MEGRTMKLGGLRDNLEQEAKNLYAEFKDYTSGTRCMMLLHRTKDGGSTNEFKRRGGMYISHSKEEWFTGLMRLLTLQAVSDRPYRLYTSCNPRDIKKAEKAFKMDMLVCDFDDGENKEYFWQRLDSKWMGALMKPGSRLKGSRFMLDVDGGEPVHQKVLIYLENNKIEIHKQYKTPNGWHIITDPFNPNELSLIEGVEVKPDGLLLIKS